MSKRILGIAGKAGSGKDTVGNILAREHGYTHVSSSDCVRSEIANRGEKPSRKLQTQVANELRKTFGGVWVQRAIESEAAGDRLAISGLYAPAEALFLKQIGGMLLYVAQSGGNTQSHARIRNRAEGERDRISPTDLDTAIDRESSGQEDWQANVSAMAEFADFRIQNDGSIDELAIAVSEVANRLEAAYE